MLSVHIYDKGIQVENHKIKILYNLSSPLEVNEQKLDTFDILLVNAADKMLVEQSEVNKMTYAIFYPWCQLIFYSFLVNKITHLDYTASDQTNRGNPNESLTLYP